MNTELTANNYYRIASIATASAYRGKRYQPTISGTAYAIGVCEQSQKNGQQCKSGKAKT